MKKKSIIFIIIAIFILLFGCVLLGVSHNDSFGSYNSIKEFEKARSIQCLKVYDIYDYINNNQFIDLSNKDVTVKSDLFSSELSYRIVDKENDIIYRIEKGDASGMINEYDHQVLIPLSVGEVFIGDKEYNDEIYINVVYRMMSEGFNDIYIEFDIKKNDLIREEVDQKIVTYLEEIIKNNKDYFSL